MANGLAKILRPKMFYGPIKPAFMHTLLFIHMYIYATLAAFLSKKISAQIWFIWAVCILCKYCNVKKVQISQLLLYLMCFPFLVFSLKDTWNLFLSLSFSLSLSLSLLYSYLSISLYISICMHKKMIGSTYFWCMSHTPYLPSFCFCTSSRVANRRITWAGISNDNLPTFNLPEFVKSSFFLKIS